MKHYSSVVIFVVFFLFSFVHSSFALEDNTKFGNPTQEEMEMTVYDLDPDAAAVKLYHETTVRYNYMESTGSWRISYAVRNRVKVLKQEGVDEANIAIIYYSPTENGASRENVMHINATSYNLEGGKMVKTKMKSNLIFKERINDSYEQIKFSIPQVKEGTVFEYEYTLNSDRSYELKDWDVQENIPVHLAHLSTEVPITYDFSVEARGSGLNANTFQSKRTDSVIRVHLSDGEGTINSVINEYTVRNLKALKDEGYVFSLDDYAAKIVFDLTCIRNTYGGVVQQFNSTWDNVDRILREEEHISSSRKMDNPLEKEQAALGLFVDKSDVAGIATTLRNLLQQKVKWNEQYGIMCDNRGSKIVKDGSCSSAEMNYIMLSMLKDAGVEAFPVFLRRRTSGRLPLTHPSVGMLNAMVLAIPNGKDTLYMDASDKYGSVGVLNPNLMSERARLMHRGETSFEGQWVNLLHSSTYKDNVRINITMDENAVLRGKNSSKYEGQGARTIRALRASAKDSTDYVEQRGASENATITLFSSIGYEDYSNTYSEEFDFEKELDADDMLYINPLMFVDYKSCLKSETRSLPVEFPFLYSARTALSITIPDNYEIVEYPKGFSIASADGTLSTRVQVVRNGQQISMVWTQRRNSTIYSEANYADVKQYYDLVEQKAQELLVVRKR